MYYGIERESERARDVYIGLSRAQAAEAPAAGRHGASRAEAGGAAGAPGATIM